MLTKEQTGKIGLFDGKASYYALSTNPNILKQYKIVSTADEFYDTFNENNGYGTYRVLLNNDINVSGYAGLGKKQPSITGTAVFDGMGYRINGLGSGSPISSFNGITNNLGLFGSYRGIFRNVGLENFNISLSGIPNNQSWNIGSIAGKYEGILSNVYATGNISFESPSAVRWTPATSIGGMVGRLENSEIRNSNVSANLWFHAEQDSGEYRLGGMVGSMTNSHLYNVYHRGNMDTYVYLMYAALYAGGIVGSTDGSITNNSRILSAYHDGYIMNPGVGERHLSTIYHGGIVGRAFNDIYIGDTYNFGIANERWDYTDGGIVGLNASSRKIISSYTDKEIESYFVDAKRIGWFTWGNRNNGFGKMLDSSGMNDIFNQNWNGINKHTSVIPSASSNGNVNSVSGIQGFPNNNHKIDKPLEDIIGSINQQAPRPNPIIRPSVNPVQPGNPGAPVKPSEEANEKEWLVPPGFSTKDFAAIPGGMEIGNISVTPDGKLSMTVRNHYDNNGIVEYRDANGFIIGFDMIANKTLYPDSLTDAASRWALETINGYTTNDVVSPDGTKSISITTNRNASFILNLYNAITESEEIISLTSDIIETLQNNWGIKSILGGKTKKEIAREAVLNAINEILDDAVDNKVNVTESYILERLGSESSSYNLTNAICRSLEKLPEYVAAAGEKGLDAALGGNLNPFIAGKNGLLYIGRAANLVKSKADGEKAAKSRVTKLTIMDGGASGSGGGGGGVW